MRIPRIARLICLPAMAALAAGTLAAASPPAHRPATAGAVPAASALPTFDHVVIVLFENKNYTSIKGSSSAPYLNSLAGQGTLFTSSFGLTHPSQPNYVGLFSGSMDGINKDDCAGTLDRGNLGKQLLDAGKSFKGYSEGMPQAGYTGCASGRYARKHAPWVNFPTVRDAAYNVPYSSFPSDYSKLPTVSFAIPDMCNDMHDCDIGSGDSWVKKNLDAYAQWAKTHNSLLITTFDEDNFTSVNQIHTVFVGEHVKAGHQSSGQINHYTVLRTLEDMYGLPALGGAAGEPAITDAWTTGTSAVSVTAPGDQTSAKGQADSLQLTAAGGSAPYTWTVAGLPAGLSVDAANGLVSGTPTSEGASTVTVTAKDANGATASSTFTWTVTAAGGGSKVFSDGFETDLGWRRNADGGDTATSGLFERGVSQRTVSTYSNQAKQLQAASGSYALTTGAAAGSGYGANDLDGGTTSMTSPSITLPAGAPATLTFAYNVAHGDNSGPDDQLRVTVTDGARSATVFTRSGTAAEVAGRWQTATADLSAFAGKTVQVKVEAVDAGTPSLFEAQVDDVGVTIG